MMIYSRYWTSRQIFNRKKNPSYKAISMLCMNGVNKYIHGIIWIRHHAAGEFGKRALESGIQLFVLILLVFIL